MKTVLPARESPVTPRRTVGCSAEPAAYGVPVIAGWKRGAPVEGWFAVSQTLRQRGTAQLVNDRWELHPDALQWLDAYQPVASIGKSMLLYRIR